MLATLKRQTSFQYGHQLYTPIYHCVVQAANSLCIFLILCHLALEVHKKTINLLTPKVNYGHIVV